MKKQPSRGDRYAAEVRENYSLNESQEVLVDTIADTLDIIEGTTDPTERRAQRVILLRAIAALALPDSGADPDAPRPTSTSAKARKAAHARWSREREVG